MNASLRRHPMLRWAAPGAALALVVAGSQVAAHWPADAATSLPPRTAAQLLTDLQRAQPVALSGTVSAAMSLGLPQLPEGMAGGDPTSPISLLSGTHTAKVWYDGNVSSRVAVLGKSAETDLVTNPRGLWLWKSADQSVLHVAALPGKAMTHRAPATGAALSTQFASPAGVSQWILQLLDPTTKVTTTSNDQVAGRAAYELVLTPRTAGTKIGSVRIAIDAQHHIPLRAEVFPRGADKPAINVGFTSLSFHKPAASRFDFTPPPGAKVTTPKSEMHKAPARTHSRLTPPRIVGKAWSSVLVGQVPAKSTANTREGSLRAMLRLLPEVSGSWGSGHLLETALFSAVLTDDGHFAVGAVRPSLLYAALG